jgi:hypothetical protein
MPPRLTARLRLAAQVRQTSSAVPYPDTHESSFDAFSEFETLIRENDLLVGAQGV